MAMPRNLQPLSKLAKGNTAIFHHFSGGRRVGDRLLALGFTNGTKVMVIQNSGFGPVIVEVRDSRIALGRGEASRMMVEKLV
jgi:ferrous iron transport protein A